MWVMIFEKTTKVIRVADMETLVAANDPTVQEFAIGVGVVFLEFMST